MLLTVVISLAFAQERSVAITFDDLPVAGTTDPAEARAINLAILSALDRRRVPAIGFVIGQRVEDLGEQQGADLLKEWVSRGYDLGNHTFTHTASDELSAEQFEQDILKGEAVIAPILASAGKSPRYFRFPENHAGDTKDKHDALAAFLQQHGYQLAVCTIDNEDYNFNDAYLKMLSAKDEPSAAKLRAAYLVYTSAEIDYYAGLHKQVFGREIPHVMLLHANRLNADLTDQVLQIFAGKGYRFVTLDAALSDPAYKTPDQFVTREGWMWGYRWAKILGVKVNGSLESEPPAWILQYGK